MTQPNDTFARMTGGDPVRAEALRANLQKIADQTDNPDVRRSISEVMSGRRTLRQLVREPHFERELDRGMDAFARSVADLTPEQRAELVRQGQAAYNQRVEESDQRRSMDHDEVSPDNPFLR